MPDHIPRDPQGFEDIDAFFDSPERDESTRSGATSAVTEGDTRRTVTSTIAASSIRMNLQASRRSAAGKGRLSVMSGMVDDDEDGDHAQGQEAGDVTGFIDQDVDVNFGDGTGSRSMDIVTPSRCESARPTNNAISTDPVNLAFVRSKRHSG